jgi:LysM repeat protein
MAIAGYIVIPSDSTVKTDQLIKAGLGAAGPFARDLKFIAADIESNQVIHPASPGLRLSNALADIRRAGIPAIIYTSRSKWPRSMGANSTAFNRVPLWDASYMSDSGVFVGWGAIPITAFDSKFIKYGGWDQRAMWQLAGTVDAVPNFPNKADLNLADFARLGITTDLPVEVDMPDPRVDDILTRLAKVEGQAHGHAAVTPSPPTPTPPSPVPSPTPVRTHTVVSGDIAGLIAEKYGISLEQLKALNPGKPSSGDWNLIFPGEVFRVA